MNTCPGKDAYAQVNEMLTQISSTYFDTVWIRVEQNSSPGCSWLSNSPIKNCNYLRSLASAIQMRGIKVGIYSTAGYWKDVFQNSTYCP